MKNLARTTSLSTILMEDEGLSIMSLEAIAAQTLARREAAEERSFLYYLALEEAHYDGPTFVTHDDE
jgi:hypothetical protein